MDIYSFLNYLLDTQFLCGPFVQIKVDNEENECIFHMHCIIGIYIYHATHWVLVFHYLVDLSRWILSNIISSYVIWVANVIWQKRKEQLIFEKLWKLLHQFQNYCCFSFSFFFQDYCCFINSNHFIFILFYSCPHLILYRSIITSYFHDFIYHNTHQLVDQ